jgi:hypothetical protein
MHDMPGSTSAQPAVGPSTSSRPTTAPTTTPLSPFLPIPANRLRPARLRSSRTRTPRPPPSSRSPFVWRAVVGFEGPAAPLGTKPRGPRSAPTRGRRCTPRCRVCPNSPPLRSKGRPRRPQFRPSERELASCVVRIARPYSTRCTVCSPERVDVIHGKLRTALETRTSEVRRTGLRRSGGEVYKIRSSQSVPSSEKPSAKAASPASRHTKSLSFGSTFASR